MLGLVGESLRRWNFDRLEYSASSANSGKVATTLSRLKMTAAVRLELPCCIAGVEPVHSEIQPYRWEAGEASNLEAKKATEWLQKHVCPHGVLAVAVTSVAWMRAHWLADGISIKTSSIYSIWPQTVAEELALNFMLEHDARIGNRKVPVFGGDFNLHMITHRSAHQSSEIHCAAITKATLDKKQLAVGCMRALLQQGLAAVTAGTGPSSEGPADVAGPSQQQPPDQLRRPEAPPSLETSQPRRPETRGWLKEQGGAAGGAPSKSQYFTAELEEAYSAAMLAMVRRPEWYEAHGRDAPPHSVEHSSLAERLASMNVIR
ncbi:hypothetical protein COCSUDRAFT_55073 [Coccomyxa subellipsoidea C-169]|uniref:Uncharacterized protein n=1 Tax=Coccomyxa subellipsoidea (strain C-169) TaxID=574566 RepID=I0Z8S6_COCSC|nr:hypothetical protein COCSUDRAFT_55073 [Coccomyxa subellipsoidea C-169]EIE27045.1 hypothetical protein COCSUDRAFT_55073 [Coccomyxa subellipsoidea C-169]|eukprot:XP_005651589.1 hypothetical protein COCSUDRAFT_55073 [Coccomyxa subellipsoidea C-169]